MSYFGLLDLCFCSSWLIGVACILHLLVKYARKFVHVTVNCWFCNINSKVPLTNKSEWHCMHCDQFNGFDKNGDYSKPIPQQFNEDLNHKSYRSPALKKRNLSKSNGLCRICNANQELKIRQLAIYEPFREETYDQEIELFRQRLEKSYKLCCICEDTVRNTLKFKSSLFAKVPDKLFDENLGEITDFRTKKKNWCFISVVLFLVSILMASSWEFYPIKVDSLKSDIFADFLDLNFMVFSQEYGLIVNVLLIACVTAFIRMRNPRSRIFGRPLLLGIFFYGVRDYLPFTLKIALIVSSFIYFLITLLRRSGPRVKCTKLSNNIKNRFMEEEDERSVSDDDLGGSANSLLVSNPLCGKFSTLTLGQSSTVGCPKNAPYLFRSTKSIIQPPRLKLFETERYETPRSSPTTTTSSGYESVANFLKRSSPDSISEYDSVSQVGNNCSSSRNSALELRNGLLPRRGGSLVETSSPEGRLFNFGGDSNMMVPYMYSRNQYFLPSERCYGASPTFSPKQSSQQIGVGAVFPTAQIILCSFAFFILGFSFQIFVSKMMS